MSLETVLEVYLGGILDIGTTGDGIGSHHRFKVVLMVEALPYFVM